MGGGARSSRVESDTSMVCGNGESYREVTVIEKRTKGRCVRLCHDAVQSRDLVNLCSGF